MTKRENGLFCLGVIAARGGSKGVPRKNIRDFAGKSLIQLAVETAKGSKLLSDTLVNTDSEEIANLAREFGANVPFIRPSELGADEVPVKDVVRWTALWYEQEKGIRPDIIVTLQPTSPFRTSEHIDTAIEILADDQEAEGVISLSEVNHTPYKMRVLRDDGYIAPLLPGRVVSQRQDAPPVYIPNGIVFATRWKTLIEKSNLWGDRALPYILPEELNFNIDTPLEFEMAQWLYARGVKKQDVTEA